MRKVMQPKNGYADRTTGLLAKAMGRTWDYAHRSQVMEKMAGPISSGPSKCQPDCAKLSRQSRCIAHAGAAG